jgi:adenosine kinase
MTVAISGPLAFDQLMRFDGRFAEHILANHLDNLTLSFIADDMIVRRGGVGGNLAYGLAQLGVPSALVAAVGRDADDYLASLADLGVDTALVRVSESRLTARYVCTTDNAMCQMSTFYVGAAGESGEISMADVRRSIGVVDLAVIGAGAPATMRAHARECRELGIPFIADPSQQLAAVDADGIIDMITGATLLITNEYETGLLYAKTGLSSTDVLQIVGTHITTLGAKGIRVRADPDSQVIIPAAPVHRVVDPTGAGDAMRAGLIAGLRWGLPIVEAVEVGAVMAATVLEVTGPQDYSIDAGRMIGKMCEAFGERSGELLRNRLSGHSTLKRREGS